MRANRLLILGLALVLIAFVGIAAVLSLSANRMMSVRYRQQTAFRTNGERIYYTATSNSGRPISFTGGPHWLRMHGGSCVTCHGPTGRGGARVPMTGVTAPDIRYSTLIAGKHTDGEEMEHPPYTEATIRRAITEGLDPSGGRLSPVMPRWRMSERDLGDLVDHLKTLDGAMPGR